MLSRSLLARSSPLRLSVAQATRVCSRPLSTLHLPHLARHAVPSSASLRRFSVVPAMRTKNQDDSRPSHPPSGMCYVANIPYRVTAEELKDAFSEFGKVVSIKLLTTNDGLPRGAGFVQFESVADAVNFVEAHALDPIYLLDRQIFVEHAQQARNMWGTVPPCDTLMVPKFQGKSEAEVRALFGSHAADVLAVRFDRKEVNQPLRKAFVQFRDVDTAMEAMEAFKSQNEATQITYARQRQPPFDAHSLASRLSQRRAQ